MRCLVVVHDPGSEAGLVGEALGARGYELERLVVTGEGSGHSDVEFPSPTDYDLILPMGSYYSLYDDAAIGSWIHRELEFLAAADAAGVPVFGVCFGGQAIAAALGGSVETSDEEQIGFFDVDGNPAAGLPPGPWMQWHGDRFTPPPDAEILSSDPSCVQAFRVRRNLGVQFHPEVTVELVSEWIDNGGAQYLEERGMAPAELLADIERNVPDAAPRTAALVDFFLDTVAIVETVPTGSSRTAG